MSARNGKFAKDCQTACHGKPAWLELAPVQFCSAPDEIRA